MKKVLFFAISTFLVFTLITCNKENNPNCGADKIFALNLIGYQMFDSSSGYYYSYMEGNNRVFQWSDVVSDVCPEEHVKASFRVSLRDDFSIGQVDARARISYALLFEREFTMGTNINDLEASGEVGLQQAFGTDPAEFVPVLEVFFPTKGSYSADKLYFQNHVEEINITAEYLDYKY